MEAKTVTDKEGDKDTAIRDHLHRRLFRKRDLATVLAIYFLNNPEAQMDFWVKNQNATDTLNLTPRTTEILLDARDAKFEVNETSDEELAKDAVAPALKHTKRFIRNRRIAAGVLGFTSFALSAGYRENSDGASFADEYIPILLNRPTNTLYKWNSDNLNGWVNQSYGDECAKIEYGTASLGAGLLTLLCLAGDLHGRRKLPKLTQEELEKIRSEIPQEEVLKELDALLDKLEPLLNAAITKIGNAPRGQSR
jgi:hypothetical protein